MDAQKLTEAAFAASGATSFRAFADEVGVSHVTVLAWLNGTRVPSFEHAATLAKIAGLPIVKTASEVRLAAPENAKNKGILKHLAATATILMVAALPFSAQAKPGSDFAINPDTAHYVTRLGYYWGVLRDWMAHRLHRPQPASGVLEARTCL